MDVGVTSRPLMAAVDVVQEVAGATGSPTVRLGAAVEVLMRAVGATMGVLASGGPDDVDMRALAGYRALRAVPHAPTLRVTTDDLPLLDRVRSGSVDVVTAERLRGKQAWEGSVRRRHLLENWHVDQLVSIPVHGGDVSMLVLLGRQGPDFSDEDLQLLTQLRPLISALADILEPAELPEPTTHLVRLTSRESTMLAYLAQGLTAARIARLAGCSPRTVHHHLSSIYHKLDVGDRLSAVNRARELGLVEEDEDRAVAR